MEIGEATAATTVVATIEATVEDSGEEEVELVLTFPDRNSHAIHM